MLIRGPARAGGEGVAAKTKRVIDVVGVVVVVVVEVVVVEVVVVVVVVAVVVDVLHAGFFGLERL